MQKEIVFVSGADWIAMYIDGIKVVKGHSISYHHILTALGIRYSNIEAPKNLEYYAEDLYDIDFSSVV